MINFGVPKKYVDIVKTYNAKTVIKVKFLGKLWSEFEVNLCLRQGDVLFPTLVKIGLEKVIIKLSKRLGKMEVVGKKSLTTESY